MEKKNVNWSLTLIFCLIFGALGFIAGSISNCGKANSCKAPQEACSPHHDGEWKIKKTCSAEKKCHKHKEHKEEVIIEVEEITTEE